MKLLKVLTISDKKQKLAFEDVRLDLFAPGRASFVVEGDEPLSGLVTFDIGYGQDQNLKRWFTGYVENSRVVAKNQVRVFCRELTASLNRLIPLSVRHINLKELAAELHEKTGLIFRLPDTDYIQKRVPCFYHVGGGYHCLDAIGDVFEIPNYIWQQQGNGEVFLGDWRDSFWSDKPVTIPDGFFVGHLADEGATVKAIPALRPGVRLADGRFIHSIQLENSDMRVTWSNQLKR